MRTVFVNPSYRGKYSKRRNPYILSNPGGRRRRRNPGFGSLNNVAKETLYIAAGAAGGATLNRLGISHISNFYLRNGARVLAAAFLSSLKTNRIAAIAAAGAALAPIVPEVEMQLATGSVKNPNELAAELADILEADLSDELEDDGDELNSELDEVY